MPKFNKGDKVVRILHSFEKVLIGSTYIVAECSDTYVCLEGHFVRTGRPAYVSLMRYDLSCFKLAPEQAQPEHPTVDDQGQSLHVKGAKDDSGKNRLGLVLGGFPLALAEVGKVGTFGANKYTDNGWQSVPNGIGRYTDALLRHHFSEAAGELADPESKIAHAAHRAWNALAVLELQLREAKDTK